MAASSIIELLSSSMKLDRDRGVSEIQKHLNTTDEGHVLSELFDELRKIIQSPEGSWEGKHGALLGSKCCIPHLNVDIDQHEAFVQMLKTSSLDFLTDQEVRIRLAAGEVLGSLCNKLGPQIYAESNEKVLSLVRSNLERDLDDRDMAPAEHKETEKLVEKLVGSRQRTNSADASQIFHDTAGWKCLETSMKCLQAMIEGCGVHFQPHVDQELLDLVFTSLTHTNRFVRETGFQVCAALVSCGGGITDEDTEDEEADVVLDTNPLVTYGLQLSTHLARGLSDNWSQVRLAASVAARKFLVSLPSEASQEMYFPDLLPRMCLNRYYMAEGVRIYSQDTWRQVTGTRGRELVQKYISDVATYYIESTKADNHAVREAACACIAELAAKIDHDALQDFVSVLLQTLLECFQDESWPVRDAACLACGNFIRCYPEEARPLMPSLYPLFYANLQDNIASVRQGAAGALANVVRAYGDEALKLVAAQITSGLAGIANQPSESEKYGDLDMGPATFGVVKRRRDNDLDLHTDQQMYSCGSLAPKMGRGGGCMDHKFRKPPEPWELADGCVYLIAELSQIPEAVGNISPLLPQLADACRHRHFAYHVAFLETVCKQLPTVAKGVGKRQFKSNLELFFDAIFYSLECENALTSSAASQCMNQLGSFLGPNILRGRVENYNPSYLKQLDANVFIAPF